MKQPRRPNLKQMREDLLADYMPLAEAAKITGLTSVRLLAFCEARNIRHIKRYNRWLVHKQDLVTALQQDLSDGGA